NKAIRSASDSTLTVVGDYPFEDYKTGTQIGLPATEISTYQPSDTDYKAGPWFGTLLFYDTDELAKVAQGIKQPNEVKPYAMFNLESFLKRRQGNVPSKALPIGGVTFDATYNKLYVQELLVDGSYPIIHVFQLQDNGNKLPSTPPTAPANVVNKKGRVSWSASMDADGGSMGISYVIFKLYPAFKTTVTNGSCAKIGGKVNVDKTCSFAEMWRPVAGTTNTTWSDPGYIDGDKYNVTAYDLLMRPSN